jgi:predicted small lipoprotein YifL
MKKLIAVSAAAVFVAGLLAGCGKKDEKTQLQDSLKGL